MSESFRIWTPPVIDSADSPEWIARRNFDPYVQKQKEDIRAEREKRFPGLQVKRVDGVETIWFEKRGRRMIHGIASTPTVNSHGDSWASSGCEARFPIPLLFGHGLIEDKRGEGGKRVEASPDLEQLKIGEIVLVRKSEQGIYVIAVIDEGTHAGDDAWKLIESGKALCFSVGGESRSFRLRGVVDGHRYYDRWRLKEVSVCRKGANPDCTFSIYHGAMAVVSPAFGQRQPGLRS